MKNKNIMRIVTLLAVLALAVLACKIQDPVRSTPTPSPGFVEVENGVPFTVEPPDYPLPDSELWPTLTPEASGPACNWEFYFCPPDPGPHPRRPWSG